MIQQELRNHADHTVLDAKLIVAIVPESVYFDNGHSDVRSIELSKMTPLHMAVLNNYIPAEFVEWLTRAEKQMRAK